MLWIFYCLLSVFCSQKEIDHVPVLVEDDLRSTETFLIYLYYEKPRFSCPTCSYFESYLDQLPIPIKRLNFATNTRLGSKFLSLKFPALIVRDKAKSYVIEPKSGEELLEVLRSRSWVASGPVKWYFETDSKIATIFSFINMFIFYTISKAYFIIDNVPDYVVSFFVLAVITYLIYSIIEIFREPNLSQGEKTKND